MMRMLSESDRLDSGSAASSSSTKKRRIASSTSSSSSDTRDRARSRSVVRMEAGHTREKGSSRICKTGANTGADKPGSSTRADVPKSSTTRADVPGSSTRADVPGSYTRADMPGSAASTYRSYVQRANSLMPREDLSGSSSFTREKGSSRIGETGGPTGADMPGSSSRTEKSANKYRAYMHQANSLMPRRVDTAPTRLLQQVFISGEEIQVPALLQIITIVRTTPDREVGKFSLLLSWKLVLKERRD